MDETPQSNPKYPANNADPVKIHKVKADSINIICLSCKKFLGHIAYIDKYSMWNIGEVKPLCAKCFEEKVGAAAKLLNYDIEKERNDWKNVP